MNLNPITIISNVFALVLIQPLCWCCYKWICTIPLSKKSAKSLHRLCRSRRKRSLKRKSHSASLCNWDSFRIGALVDSWLQTNLSSALGPDLESALREQLLATTTIKIMNRKRGDSAAAAAHAEINFNSPYREPIQPWHEFIIKSSATL